MSIIGAPVDDKFILQPGFEIYVTPTRCDAPVRVGYFKDPSTDFAGASEEEVFANGSMQKISDSDRLTVNYTIHEQRPELLEILFAGLVTRRTTTNVLITGEQEMLQAGAWTNTDGAQGQCHLVRLANADSTVVTNVVITGSAGDTLVAGVDYELTVDAVFGYSVIKFLSAAANISTIAQALTITYDVTPDNAESLAHDSSCGQPIPHNIILEQCAKNCSTGEQLIFRTTIENATTEKAYPQLIGFKDTATVGTPIVATGYIIDQKWITK